MLFHREEIKRQIQHRADGTDGRRVVAGEKGDPRTEYELNDGQNADEKIRDPV